MGYDRDDSFPFNFEPNRVPFGLNSKVRMSPRSYPIQYERKWSTSFLSVEGFVPPIVSEKAMDRLVLQATMQEMLEGFVHSNFKSFAFILFCVVSIFCVLPSILSFV